MNAPRTTAVARLVLTSAAMVLVCACAAGPGHRLGTDALPALPDDDRTVHLGLIERMQDEGAYYASLAHVEAYRLRHGDSPRLRLLQAEALRSTGQTDTAGQVYRSLLGGPYAAQAWHGLGLIAASTGETAQAEQALAKAAELAPLNADYLGDLGFQHLRAGRLDLALAPLAKAAELAPENQRAVANLALWALLDGDARRAETLMDKAGLPDTSRQAIHRLATELRPALHRTPAHPVTRNHTASTSPVAAAAGIPAPKSMLERFGPPQQPEQASDER